MLATTVGKALMIIHKWKSIPKRKNDGQIRRCNKLERNLANYAMKGIKISFEKLKNELQDGEALKKRAIHNLMSKTMSQHKRLFLNWHSRVAQSKQVQKCARTISLFERITQTLNS